jgi:S-sulfo-L-cysteine synthase (O-acetyl-L-serine-dependent)
MPYPVTQAPPPPTTSTSPLETHIGHTPLLPLARLAQALDVPPTAELLAKAEWFNPSGSIKDRAAHSILHTAAQEGRLRPGQTILDSTSGNMGIAYAMLAAVRGYHLRLIMPANVGEGRLAILRQYGVEMVLTDPALGSNGAVQEARRQASADPRLFYANQYDNPANWRAYYHTLASEIWRQTHGRVTHFVAGVGSSGTFMGTSKRLRELNLEIVCAAVQPATAADGSLIKGLKHMPSAIQPAIYNPRAADLHLTVGQEEVVQMQQLLAKWEGLLVGPSSAANVVATVRLAKAARHGRFVTVLPDNAHKYKRPLKTMNHTCILRHYVHLPRGAKSRLDQSPLPPAPLLPCPSAPPPHTPFPAEHSIIRSHEQTRRHHARQIPNFRTTRQRRDGRGVQSAPTQPQPARGHQGHAPLLGGRC